MWGQGTVCLPFPSQPISGCLWLDRTEMPATFLQVHGAALVLPSGWHSLQELSLVSFSLLFLPVSQRLEICTCQFKLLSAAQSGVTHKLQRHLNILFDFEAAK